MVQGVTVADYGTWSSSVTSETITQNSRQFRSTDVKACTDRVFWSEGRPEQSGRYVICSADLKEQEQGTFTEWTPDGFGARSAVHEYGGGSFWLDDIGRVYFCNSSDQRIYLQQSSGDAPVPVTPAETGCRYADGVVANNGIYCVREDHGPVNSGNAREPINTIIYINLESQEQTVLVEGCDFYASPKVSPDGNNLAWIQWCHPNMPWDTTEACLADLNGYLIAPGSIRKIGAKENVSYVQTEFSPDGRLFYISDETNWWNLYVYDNKTGLSESVYPQQSEEGGPHWTFDNTSYSIDPNDSNNVIVSTNSYQKLWLVDVKTKIGERIDTGYCFHWNIKFGGHGRIYCLAGRPDGFMAIIGIDSISKKIFVLREQRDDPISPDLISIPTHITFPTTTDDQGSVAHGYFYEPKNPAYKAPPSTLPPLLLMAHGGPTGATFPTLDLKKIYYTSRGFAVLDVNYRGSTSYGRAFRNLLREKWGILDIDDCCNGALHLVKEGKVDKDKLCVTGGSAGGYVVLASLTFKDVFAVGVSHFGVSDMIALATETHKFEARYTDSMIGPYPEAEKTYKERSPINYPELLRKPVAFFQGTDDKIVPANQAEMLFTAIKDKGLPTAFVLFEGEGHGFRKGENVRTALDGEYYFFCIVLDIPISHDMSNVIQIHNLEKCSLSRAAL